MHTVSSVCNRIKKKLFFHFCRLKSGEYVKEVEIGEFMDILCPHKGLVGITTGPKDPLIEFDIYNVTEDLYHKCQSGGKDYLFCK